MRQLKVRQVSGSFGCQDRMSRTHGAADRFALLGAINPMKAPSKLGKKHRVSDAEISEFLVMRIEDAGPLIGAVVTEVDVRSLTEPDGALLTKRGWSGTC